MTKEQFAQYSSMDFNAIMNKNETNLNNSLPAISEDKEVENAY